MLLNKNVSPKILEIEDQIICKFELAFRDPTSRVGRAHFYAPVKKIGNLTIDTLWFNVVFIWITILIFYITLYYDVLAIVINKFENIKLRKAS